MRWLKNEPHLVRDGLVAGYERWIDLVELPDAADAHVLAAAIECGATTIVTANLRDFPPPSSHASTSRPSTRTPSSWDASTPIPSSRHDSSRTRRLRTDFSTASNGTSHARWNVSASCSTDQGSSEIVQPALAAFVVATQVRERVGEPDSAAVPDSPERQATVVEESHDVLPRDTEQPS